jgi:pyrroloquinoline-quinone synthase
VAFALGFVKQHAKTAAERQAVCEALIFKTNVLWAQLVALYSAYVGWSRAAGRFRSGEGVRRDSVLFHRNG